MEFAASFAKNLKPGDILAFRGGMGAGKTAFIRGLARGLGYEGPVSSPTFALVHEYEGGRLPLYHFDLYRLETYEDLLSCGFFDYAEQGGVLAAEWSEKAGLWLPENIITIEIGRDGDENSRVINIRP